MNTTTRTSTAERLGRAFGRGWRAYARCERRASNWLVSRACRRLEPPRSCGWLLAALGVLLYTTFWLALVMVCVMVVAWMARNTDLGEELPEPEWRNGPAGFGLYTYDGFRIDPHVEDD